MGGMGFLDPTRIAIWNPLDELGEALGTIFVLKQDQGDHFFCFLLDVDFYYIFNRFWVDLQSIWGSFFHVFLKLLFLDIVFGRILVRSWEGFEGILNAVDTKSRSRSGSGSGGEGGGGDGGGGVGFWW